MIAIRRDGVRLLLEADVEEPFNHQPERRLVAAFLMRACEDYALERAEFGRERLTAVWIFDNTEPAPAWSFLWACRALKISPNRLRRYLRKRWQLLIPDHSKWAGRL